MTPDEREVLLAATTAPLYPVDGSWMRTDGLGWLPRLFVRCATVDALLGQELLRVSTSGAATLTPAGLAQAKAIRHALGQRRRQILAAIDAASELVRRERPATETVTEWMRPIAAERWIPDPREPDNPFRGHTEAPTRICSGSELQDLVDRGLVVLLNGGTRAALSGAGRWCATGTRDSD